MLGVIILRNLKKTKVACNCRIIFSNKAVKCLEFLFALFFVKVASETLKINTDNFTLSVHEVDLQFLRMIRFSFFILYL